MLEPHDRRLLLDALHPPDGYAFDEGIGTTFTLDLLALLMAPLGFTMLELQDSSDGEIGESDALVLLRTLRQYADRLTIFCQTGRIAVPRGQGRLLASLEGSVVEVTAPISGGVFHPKVWALRYVAPDTADLPVAYRLLVLSRNLTFDRSWDTMLVLDGTLQDRVNAIAANHPLGDFIEALPELAIREVGPGVTDRIQRFQHELRRVDFRSDFPEHVDEAAFHPVGIPGYRRNPLSGRKDRLLVVSPFLSASRLGRLASDSQEDILVSRAEELQKLSSSQLEGYGQVLTLSPEADQSAESDPEGEPGRAPEAGLHAKLFVADAGRNARVFTGSANATSAAFERNVEFLVELTGSKSKLGIDRLLEQRDGAVGLRDLLVPFTPPDSPVAEDADACAAEEALDAARLAIAGVGWVARVTGRDDAFDLSLSPVRAPTLPASVESVRAHPIMLPASASKSPGGELGFEFAGVTMAALTSFFAFDLSVRVGAVRLACQFVVNAELQGAPTDRRDAILRSLLRDRRQVIRFLMLLLADDEQLVHGELGTQHWTPGAREAGTGTGGAEALLETLLRSLHRHPHKLADVERLLRDLESTETPDDPLVPPGLREIVAPILAARGSAE